jgi:hypothetical protein
MNSNEAGELPTEVAAFLAEHAQTGAPTRDELSALALRLDQALTAQTVVAMPRRAWLPPEVWAVAAVVVLGVVIQGVFLALRPDDAPQPEGVRALYRTGQLAEAQHLASSSCTDEACRALSTQLLRALELSRRLPTLTDAELDELQALDASLSGGATTELTTAIRERRATQRSPDPTPVTAPEPTPSEENASAALSLKHARAQWERREYAEAVTAVEALAQGSGALAQEARTTLSAWRADLAHQAAELYQRGTQAMASNPDEAVRLFDEVTYLTEPDADVHQQALARLAQLRPDAATGAETLASEVVVVRVGGEVQRVVDGLERLAIGDSRIAQVELASTTALRIIGVAPGKTTLLVWAHGARTSTTVEVTP